MEESDCLQYSIIDTKRDFMIVFYMLSFFKKWKKKRELKKINKLIRDFEEMRENLLKKAEALEEFANRRIKELELKLDNMEQQLEIFEKIIDSLDPKKRVN
jgi:DNA-binding transcriptional MerR regulator